MSRNTYILFCIVVLVVTSLFNYSQDDDGSYRRSGGYYGGSGFSGGHK